MNVWKNRDGIRQRSGNETRDASANETSLENNPSTRGECTDYALCQKNKKKVRPQVFEEEEKKPIMSSSRATHQKVKPPTHSQRNTSQQERENNHNYTTLGQSHPITANSQ